MPDDEPDDTVVPFPLAAADEPAAAPPAQEHTEQVTQHLFAPYPGDPPMAPVPTIAAVLGLPDPGVVLLRISTPSGVQVFFLAPAAARQIALNLKRAAVDAEVGPKLVTPPGAGRLAYPKQN